MENTLALPQAEVERRSFIVQVYHWMTAGLAFTGLIAWWVSSQPQLVHAIIGNRALFWILIIAEFGLVLALAGWVQRMSPLMAAAAFLGYAALNGLTLSVIFLIYTSASIATAFFVTAGTFGAASMYGYFTKTDLTSVGNFCFMGLIGVILASVVNFWFKSPAVYWVTTYAGVIIFVGLTAYDTQKIEGLFRGDESAGEERKEAIAGALALYLDFINLFLDLLRIMGRRRD